MAETLASLRTRLANRMGHARLHSQEQTRYNEAINSAIAKVKEKGAPGVTKRRFTAFSWGAITLSNFSHTAGASTATTTDSDVSNIAAGDILDAGGVKSLIYGFDYDASPKVFDLGAARKTQLTGTIVVYRRSIILPTAGEVMFVIQQGKSNTLQRFEGAAAAWDRETGEAKCYEQSWDSDREKSILMLYPAPTAETEFIVIQSSFTGRLLVDADVLPWTEQAVELVLSEAAPLLTAWGRGAGQIEAVMLDKAAAEAPQGGARARGAFKIG